MFTAFVLSAFALVASVKAIPPLYPRNGAPPGSCCFPLTAYGLVSGTLGQIADGQVRIGGGYAPVIFCSKDGKVIDQTHSGCILAGGPAQFQCDEGKPVSGFSVDCAGNFLHISNQTFYACPVNDRGEWNVYKKPITGQAKCVPITLNTDGNCLPDCASTVLSTANGSSATQQPPVQAIPSPSSVNNASKTSPPQQALKSTATKGHSGGQSSSASQSLPASSAAKTTAAQPTTTYSQVQSSSSQTSASEQTVTTEVPTKPGGHGIPTVASSTGSSPTVPSPIVPYPTVPYRPSVPEVPSSSEVTSILQSWSSLQAASSSLVSWGSHLLSSSAQLKAQVVSSTQGPVVSQPLSSFQAQFSSHASSSKSPPHSQGPPHSQRPPHSQGPPNSPTPSGSQELTSSRPTSTSHEESTRAQWSSKAKSGSTAQSSSKTQSRSQAPSTSSPRALSSAPRLSFPVATNSHAAVSTSEELYSTDSAGNFVKAKPTRTALGGSSTTQPAASTVKSSISSPATFSKVSPSPSLKFSSSGFLKSSIAATSTSLAALTESEILIPLTITVTAPPCTTTTTTIAGQNTQSPNHYIPHRPHGPHIPPFPFPPFPGPFPWPKPSPSIDSHGSVKQWQSSNKTQFPSLSESWSQSQHSRLSTSYSASLVVSSHGYLNPSNSAGRSASYGFSVAPSSSQVPSTSLVPSPAPSPSHPAPSSPSSLPSPSSYSRAPPPSRPSTSSSSQAAAPPMQHFPHTSHPRPTVCPADIKGSFQFPHLIIPVSPVNADKPYGTGLEMYGTAEKCTLFNFHVPADYTRKTCSLVFMLPKLCNVDKPYKFEGEGGLVFWKMNHSVSPNTTWNSMGAGSKFGSIDKLVAGENTRVASFPCPARHPHGFTVSICTTGNVDLEFTQDMSPTPIGLYMRAC